MTTTTATMVRPAPLSGILEWVMTTDHKKIGILYIVTGLTFFVIARHLCPLDALRSLRSRTATVLTNSQYNEIFTMHGTTMIFLVVMPLSVGLGNFLIPLHDRRPRHGFSKAERPELLAVAVRWTFPI